MPDCVLKNLQLIENNAARLVVRKKKHDCVTPLMTQLHWLPIKAMIIFKICLVTFKALNDLAPPYIASLITRYEPANTLLSSSGCLLQQKVPQVKMTGGCSFPVCAPQMWNDLPVALCKCNSLETFKRGLLTHLFRERYSEVNCDQCTHYWLT